MSRVYCAPPSVIVTAPEPTPTNVPLLSTVQGIPMLHTAGSDWASAAIGEAAVMAEAKSLAFVSHFGISLTEARSPTLKF